jgi:hypothetical protein
VERIMNLKIYRTNRNRPVEVVVGGEHWQWLVEERVKGEGWLVPSQIHDRSV